MRMNFETGKREAKLMAGDSGIKYWNSREKQGMQSSRKRRITRIGTHVFSLGRMIFARRESRVRMFF